MKERLRSAMVLKGILGNLSKDVLGAENYLFEDFSNGSKDAKSGETREHFHPTLLFSCLFHRLEVN